MTAFRILFAAFLVFAISQAAGRILFRWIGLRLPPSGRVFLEFVTGSSLVSTLVFLLATVHLAYLSVFALLSVILLALSWRLREPDARRQPGPERLPAGWRLLFWLPFCVFGAVYLIHAMCPDTSPDGTVYHAGLITRYHARHGFYPIRTDMFAGLAAGIEMLFWIAFAFGRNSAAAVTHLVFLLALPFGMVALARRFQMPRAGIIAALLFYLAPVAGKDGASAYIDVGAAAVVFTAFFLLEIWRTDGEERALIPAGLLCGFAFACKMTTSTIGIYAVFLVLARGAPWRISLRRAAILILCALTTAGPWLLKNAIEFHNPVFPFFNRWFPNPYQYPTVEAELRRIFAHMSDVSWPAIPWQITTGGKLAGIIGPVFLLSPLALLSLRTKEGRLLLAAFAVLFLPYFTNIGARFAIPALPFLALALAMAILGIPRIGAPLGVSLVLVHIVLSWPFWMDRWSHDFQWRIDTADWRAALRITPEPKYLADHFPDYERGLLLDRFAQPGEFVLSPGMGQIEWHHQDLLGTYESSVARRAFLLYITPETPQLAATWKRRIEFPATTASRVRIFTTGARDADLRISEIRFAMGDAGIAATSKWRFDASANPWEIHYAFDGRPGSWWTSGQAIEAGMWVEVDFGQPVRFDRILVDQNADQRWGGMSAAVWTEGAWHNLRTRDSGVEEPPGPNLRRDTKNELRALGVRWMLLPGDFYGAADVKKTARDWGITAAGEANGSTLWRLDQTNP